MLREFTDAVLALLERHTALRLDPAWVDVAVAGSVLFLVLLSLVTAIARLRAGVRNARQVRSRAAEAEAVYASPPAPAAHVAVTASAPEKVQRAPETMPQHIKRPLPAAAPPSRAPLRSGAPKTARSIGTVARREDRAPSKPESEMAATVATVPATASAPETASPPPPALTAQQRKDLALALRDAVLARITEGGWFKDGAEPLTYRFNRVSLTRMQFEILLELPSPGGTPRAAHALHIRVDGRKKLNLEWGADASGAVDAAARVRFLSPGDWTAAITSWQFDGRRTPVASPPARKRA
jgi:hypothetical protein